MRIYSLFLKLTIASIYLVILAGGVVRCTGSGMGCPDWPKCFGNWIPPTSVAELPPDYVSMYSDHGRLTVEFNVWKTWTEYINRLLGVLAGFFMIFVVLFSFKTSSLVRFYSIVAFVLLLFQGWLGSRVVATNLDEFMITIHMLVALVILIFLHRAYAEYCKEKIISRYTVNIPLGHILWLNAALVLLGLQILLGTQVRQQVDHLLMSVQFVEDHWYEQLSYVFSLHRFMAYLLVGILIFVIIKLRDLISSIEKAMILGLILVEFGTGLSLALLNLPKYIQPVHLLTSSLLFGVLIHKVNELYIAKMELLKSKNINFER